jgi:hypothetical protein
LPKKDDYGRVLGRFLLPAEGCSDAQADGRSGGRR